MNMTICPFCKKEIEIEQFTGKRASRFDCKNCKLEFGLTPELIDLAKRLHPDQKHEGITKKEMEKIAEILQTKPDIPSLLKDYKEKGGIGIIGSDLRVVFHPRPKS